MVAQELINQVSIPDPEHEDLRFNESKYLEIQKKGSLCCPLCGNKLQERKQPHLQDKLSRFRCQTKSCIEYRNKFDIKLSDLL